MKRLCLILAYLFLFTQTASAMPLLVGQKVVYRGTVTGLRISAVDGTAFIDNLPYTYSSDFSAGEDGWTATQGTIAGNIDSIGGIDNWVRLTCGTTSAVYRIKKSTTTVSKGKKYTITFTYYIPSGQSNIDGVRLMFNGGSQGGSSIQSVVDTATTVTVTVTATTTGQIEFWAYDGAETTFADPGGDDVFYIKDIKISEIQPYADGNHQIEIYDSSNRMLKGVLKAAGTSEGLGDDLLSGWDFTSGWTPKPTTIINSSSSFTAGDASGYVTKVASISKKLLKSAIDGTVSVGVLSLRGGGSELLANSSTPIYRTGEFDNILAHNGFASAGSITNISSMSCQQVTAPSSAGATIVSAKGGTTYNFSYKNASFTYNEASYYVIIRAIR